MLLLEALRAAYWELRDDECHGSWVPYSQPCQLQTACWLFLSSPWIVLKSAPAVWTLTPLMLLLCMPWRWPGSTMSHKRAPDYFWAHRTWEGQSAQSQMLRCEVAKMWGSTARGVTHTCLLGVAFITWFSALRGGFCKNSEGHRIGLLSIFHIKPTHCQLLVCHMKSNKCRI